MESQVLQLSIDQKKKNPPTMEEILAMRLVSCLKKKDRLVLQQQDCLMFLEASSSHLFARASAKEVNYIGNVMITNDDIIWQLSSVGSIYNYFIRIFSVRKQLVQNNIIPTVSLLKSQKGKA